MAMKMKTMNLAELPAFVQKHITLGDVVSMKITRGKKIVADLQFFQQVVKPSKTEVRIPCVIVPESIFQKQAREKLI